MEDASFTLGVAVLVAGVMELSVGRGIELGSPGDRGPVDPVAADGQGEHIESSLVVFDDDVGVVGVSSSGHGGVDTAAVGRCVDEEEGDIDGAALGGVTGLGVAEFEILGDIFGREPEVPVRPSSVTLPSEWTRVMVQWSRFLTICPRSVRRRRSLRRVTTSSPTSIDAAPTAIEDPSGSSSPMLMRVCWASRLR